MHPEYDYKKLCSDYKIFDNKLDNLRFDINDLNELIKITSFAVHRGSTAIIKACSESLIPIYYGNEKEMNISPLANLDNIKYIINNEKDFVNFVTFI